MALVLKDRVVESSTSTGTGAFTLSGAETGYQSFSVIGNGNTTYYTIQGKNSDGTLTSEWEVGQGTYNAGVLSRDTVLESSNSNALVNFSIGLKDVFCDLPAEHVITTAGTGLSISGNSITNTAPDQVVSITASTAINVTGTYPNFTITNTAPDQLVTLTAGSNVSITGTYPNFTIASGGGGGMVYPAAGIPNSTGAAWGTSYSVTGTGTIVALQTNPTLYNPNIDVIDFDQTYTTPLTAGQLGWDGNNTLALGMAGGNVTQHIGEDLYFYCKATSAITKGQVVMFTGAVGASGVPTGAPATGITDGTYIMGIAAESIALNGFGLVQSFGELRNVNTATYADGDILWYNPAVTGGLTKTQPSAPNIKVQMAAVINGGSAGGGTILIRVNSGSTLGGTDSNVQITSPANGNILSYDGGNGYWKNTSIVAGTAISVSSSANGVLTITNTSPSSGGTVTNVSGTAPISVATGTTTPVVSMTQSSGSTNGWLSSTDWTTFNNKQPAGSYLTAVTADAPLSGSGTSGSHLVIAQANTTASGYLSSTDWNTFNNKGSGTVTSVTATSPITSTGGTTPVIAMPAATTSASGYLTSTDWTTFNGKYSVGSALGTPSSGTLTNCTELPVGGISATGTPSSATYLRGDGTWSTPTSVGVNSVTGTAPISVSTTLGVANVSISQATTSTNGYLSSTDWNTFNNKGSGTVTSVSGTGTVSGLTLSGTVTNSGSLTLGGTLSAPGRLLNTQYFKTAGTATYTPTTDTNFIIVEVVGGGGGSAGSSTSASTCSGAGGGGGYARKKITSAFSGVTVTVGAGGTAGASTPTSGGNGGTSSFGALVSATGGNGANTNQISTPGGAGASGDINLTGGSGWVIYPLTVGGTSFYGTSVINANGNTSGIAGISYGGGAAGANNVGTTARAGAAGASGIVIVYEYA